MERRHPIPSLSALQAFEAVTRLLSFRKAADELSVTASAISHQVRKLEEALDVRLLDRNAGGVSPTPAGKSFLLEVQAVLDRLALAVADVRRHSSHAPLTINLPPTFAVRWLIPRLADFRREHPGIEVRVDASMDFVNLAGSDVDIAIRYGHGDWRGLHSEPLIAETLLPVCSPALLKSSRPLKEPSDLKDHVLLHNSAAPDDWDLWMTAASATGVDLGQGPSFGYSELSLRAAAEGLGVAIARRHLVQAELRSGTLVAPFDISYETGICYWLVCLPQALNDRRIAAFREWLLDEVGAQ